MKRLRQKPQRAVPVSLLFGVVSVGAVIVAGAAYIWSTGIELDRLAVCIPMGLLYVGFVSAFILGYHSYRLGRLQQQAQERADQLAATLEGMRTGQEELIHAERLAVARRMGVTIRHEINKPLAAVLGNAEWLLESEKGISQEGACVLGEIRQAAIRIRDVIRQLDEIEVVRTTSFPGDMPTVDLEKSNEAGRNQGKPSDEG